MTPTSERAEARNANIDHDQIGRAASPTSPSSVVRAALENAEHGSAERDVTMVPADYFDRLLEGIDRAEPSPGLARAVERTRRDRRIG